MTKNGSFSLSFFLWQASFFRVLPHLHNYIDIDSPLADYLVNYVGHKEALVVHLFMFC